jgi:hypothetical protein
VQPTNRSEKRWTRGRAAGKVVHPVSGIAHNGITGLCAFWIAHNGTNGLCAFWMAHNGTTGLWAWLKAL